MPIELARHGAGWKLTLTGVVSVAHATDLVVAARATVEAGTGDVVVRADGLGALDTAGVQILLALQRALATQRRALRVEGVPRPIVAQWQRAGLAGELNAG